jgi:hypothetical protein
MHRRIGRYAAVAGVTVARDARGTPAGRLLVAKREENSAQRPLRASAPASADPRCRRRNALPNSSSAGLV